MSIIIWVLIWLLVLITVIVLAVLLAPISLHAQGCLADKKELRGKINWAGGLVSFSMFMSENGNVSAVRFGFWSKRLDQEKAGAPKKKRKEKKKDAEKEAKDGSRPGFSDIVPFFSRHLWKEVFAFLGRAFRSLNLRLCLEGEYGADDPALTGYLSALVGLINSSRFKLDLNPNFQEFVLDLRGEMRARLVPAVLIFHAVVFFFGPAVRKIWWKALKSKFKRRVK